MFRLGTQVSDDIGGTLQEELTERVSRLLVEGSRVQSCLHMLQPGAPLLGGNAETLVRLTQAQPPAVLGLLFISPQELNQESGERFCGATKALAWEQWTKNGVLANQRVELRRQPPAAIFTTERT